MESDETTFFIQQPTLIIAVVIRVRIGATPVLFDDRYLIKIGTRPTPFLRSLLKVKRGTTTSAMNIPSIISFSRSLGQRPVPTRKRMRVCSTSVS